MVRKPGLSPKNGNVAVLDQPRTEISQFLEMEVSADAIRHKFVEPLPCIAIPLRQGEKEVPLDLQFVFRRAYESGPYQRGAVDYTSAPRPPLPPDLASWGDECVRAAGLRP